MVDFAPAAAPIGTDGFPKSGWTPPDTGVQLAPGGAAAAQVGGYAPAQPKPAAPAPAAVAVPIPAAPPPTVVDLSGRDLSGSYDLQWPKSIDGVEHRRVFMRRMTTGEVAAFVDLARSKPNGGRDLRFPVFFDAAGAPITDAVWNAYDPDDTDALSERADAFLPARWRTAKSADNSPPPASGTTDSSSGGSPASA